MYVRSTSLRLFDAQERSSKLMLDNISYRSTSFDELFPNLKSDIPRNTYMNQQQRTIEIKMGRNEPPEKLTWLL